MTQISDKRNYGRYGVIEMTDDKTKLANICGLIWQYGGIDGAHHKQWVLDQILRIIHEYDYDNTVELMCHGEDGPNTYDWDVGIAP